MAITTLDGLIAASKQSLQFLKTGARTTVAAIWFSLFELAGMPGAGTLAGSSTTAGVVPDDTTTGCPSLTNFAGGATGYLASVEFSNTVACRMRLVDCVFKAGAYAFNASQALSSQPSWSARAPGGSYIGFEIWIEAVTAFTGIPTIAITYTNQDGTAGRTTGAISLGVALTLGRLFRMPLQAGDTGVQKIESVTATIASAGTFNVLVVRPLWSGRVRSANDGDVHALEKTLMPIVHDSAALMLFIAADSTASGVPELEITVAAG